MFCFNGVFADSGDYALAGITPEDFVARIAAQPEPANAAQLRARKRFLDGRDFAPIEGVDPKKLAESGWAVVFPFDVDPEGALVEALRPLMDHRRKQAASIKEQRYKAILGKKLGYRPGESKEDFLERMGAGGGGAVDPDQFPYYVLLVGTPEQIPFEFQYQLDVQYAVGRLCFDQNEDYALYAQAVIAAETGVTAVPKKASFFAVATPGDPATLLSSAELVTPLASLMAADQPDWRIDTLVGEPATKSRLARLLSGDPAETPALLFTASHGLMLRPDDPEQARRQGAILCQDWPGPGKGPKPTPEDFYFAGSDIATSTRLAGLFAFHFACFSGGSPAFDDFSSEPGKPKPVAARPFVAGLPRRMAARGTLASVGHVDRAWAYSFKSEGGAAQLRVFKSALKRLMEGHPVGSAMEYFNNRYAELGSDLAQRLRAATVFGDGDPLDVAFRWQCANDARNYAVFGDPAVRMPLTNADAAVPGPVVPAGAVEFGFLDSLREAPSQISASAQRIADQLTAKLNAAVEGLSTLEIRTYSARDLGAVEFEDGLPTNASLQAVTRVGLSGEAVSVLPEKEGTQVDAAPWPVHSDLVAKAIQNRLEMLKLASSTVTGLLRAK